MSNIMSNGVEFVKDAVLFGPKKALKFAALDIECEIYEKKQRQLAVRAVRAACHGDEVYVASSTQSGWKLYKIVSGTNKTRLFTSNDPRKILDIAIFADDLFILMENKQDKGTDYEVYKVDTSDDGSKPLLVAVSAVNTKHPREPFKKYYGGWMFCAIKEDCKEDFPYGGLFAFSFRTKRLVQIDMDIEHFDYIQIGNYIFFEDGTSAVLP